MATGNYESMETAFVRRQVSRGMAVRDIGANLGSFTVHLSLLVGAAGRVNAFEPRCDLMDLLTKTITENRLANVTAHNFALGSENSDGQVTWSRLDDNPGGTHLVPPDFTTPEMAQPVL